MLVGCTGREPAGKATPEGAADAPDAATEAAVPPVDAGPDVSEEAARASRLEAARATLEAGAWDGGELYAATIRTSVMSAPAWPDDPDSGPLSTPSTAYRLGYLRHGSHVPYFPEPIVNDDCPEGWYELIEGGFVCGKYTSPDPKAPSVKFAANPPNLADPMPYKYGYSTVANTPVYRRVLSLLDRQKYEPELAPPVPATSATPSADSSPDASAPLPSASASASNDETDTPGSDEAPPDHPAPQPRHPVKDAGPVKLGDLKGRGVLVRRMMRGFYVALDRAFNAAHARWWRTAEGFAIPFERIALQSWSPDFHGSWVRTPDGEGPRGLDASAAAPDGGEAPEGNGTAVLVSSGFAARYVPNEKGKLGYTTLLPRWTALELAGEPRTVDGVAMQETTSGFWVRVSDMMVATPQPPADLAEGEKWIDIDLGRQLLVAFEGAHPVYATRVSSGRHFPWDPTHDHPTPTGTYRIYEKHISTTMDGDVAAERALPRSRTCHGSYAYFQGISLRAPRRLLGTTSSDRPAATAA